MPNVNMPIKNTEQTVTREVVRSVAMDLAIAMGISSNVKLLYPGVDSEEDIPIKTGDVSRDIAYDPEMKIIVTASEKYTEDASTIKNIQPQETMPLFNDDVIGIRLSPVYAKTELNLTVRYDFQSRSAAEKHLNDIRMYSALFRDGLFHEIKYYYFLAEPALVILKRLFELRETQGGYGQTLADYFTLYMNPVVRAYANRSGTHKTLGAEEVQTGVMGKYDYEIAPENPSRENDGAFKLEFNYTITYDKPISMNFVYPLLVHNQQIPSEFYDNAVSYDLANRMLVPSKVRYGVDAFSKLDEGSKFINGAPIPPFDDWQPFSQPANTEGMLRILVIVDSANPRDVCNLTTLGELHFKPDMVDYLKSEYTLLNLYKGTPIFVGLFEGGILLDRNDISIDVDLNVTTTFDMDIRKEYHLFVAMVTRLDSVMPTTMDRLRNNPLWCNNILLGIDSKLAEKGLLPTPISGTYISKVDLNKAVLEINSTRTPKHVNSSSMLTVGQYALIAKGRDN